MKISAAQAARDANEPDSQGLRDVLSGRKRLSAEFLAALVANTQIDGLFVLTGKRSGPVVQPLPADEQMWLDCYREWDAPVKKRELRRAMGVLSEGAADIPQTAAPTASAPASNRVSLREMSMKNTGADAVQVGYAAGKVTVKKGR